MKHLLVIGRFSAFRDWQRRQPLERVKLAQFVTDKGGLLGYERGSDTEVVLLHGSAEKYDLVKLARERGYTIKFEVL